MRFARLYAEHGDASRAYREAGFDLAGVSEAALRQRASKLARRPDVAALAARLVQEAVDAEQVTAHRTIQGLAREAFAPRSKIFGPDGLVLPPDQWPAELDALVTSVRVRRKVVGGVAALEYEVTFARPTEAKRILAQHLGLIGGKADGPEAADGKVPRVVITTEAEEPADG